MATAGQTTTGSAEIYMRLYSSEMLTELEQAQTRTLGKIEEAPDKKFGVEGR